MLSNTAPAKRESTASSTEVEDVDRKESISFPSAEGEAEQWSSDDDPEAAYRAFKNRKSLKRKRDAAASRRTKSYLKKKKDATIKKHEPGTKIVGKQNRVTKDWTRRVYEGNTDMYDLPSDEERLEEILPEYVKERRTKFDNTRENLGASGLKIPPDYGGIYFSDDENMADLPERPQLHGVKPVNPYDDIPLEYSGGIIPAPIAQYLREYQVKGAAFLHEAFVYQRGTLLGDDMGLGKTIQVIAFLTAAFGKTADSRDSKRMRKMRRARHLPWYPRILLVCPGGLMANWRSELDRWGWWHTYTYHGSASDKDAAIDAARSGRLEIMITTYNTYRKNKDVINTIEWDCVIADECHQMKSRVSEITKAMADVNALSRVGLTGTAIQNNYDELWTLLNWSNPGRFGSLLSWKTCISIPLRLGQSHDATGAQLAAARSIAFKLVKNLLPQFFMRRMKTLIADQLPKKSDRVVFCPLTETQAEAYQNFVDSETVDAIRTSSNPCECNPGKKRGYCCHKLVAGDIPWQNFVFPAINSLQKVANHLALLIPSSADPPEKHDKDLSTLQIALPDNWRDLYAGRDWIPHLANAEFCGKWKVLRKLLEYWHSSGEKVLVFSHSVRLLKMLEKLFASTSYNVSYLDGSMSLEERSRVLDDYNSNPTQFVFLISTRAGGVGLNITSANKVVVVDPHWNPSWDQQAQDRAYRIGQTRDVEVFRLVSSGTIEEIVYARQIYKQQQANIGYNASSERRYFKGVQDEKEKKGEIFGLANLFAFQGDNIVLREIVNKTNVAESKAGVQVADIDMGDIDDIDSVTDDSTPIKLEDPDATIEKLESLMSSKRRGPKPPKSFPASDQKFDAVQAILAKAGVEYTHENSEVIGTSKVESKLSRRALEQGGDIFANASVIFTHDSGPGEAILRIPRRKRDSGVKGEDDTEDEYLKGDLLDENGERGYYSATLKYRPPSDVRRRQFCTMAKTFGFEDPTEFALVVEGWTQEQRRDCLDKFYKMRRKEIIVPEIERTSGYCL